MQNFWPKSTQPHALKIRTSHRELLILWIEYLNPTPRQTHHDKNKNFLWRKICCVTEGYRFNVKKQFYNNDKNVPHYK